MSPRKQAAALAEAPAAGAAGWSDAERSLYTDLYRRVLTTRRVGETVQSLFLKGEVHGTTHLYSGQEAVAVGVSDVLGEHDRVAGTYRGHGHALALGVGTQELLDEMLGRATGINGGRAGSMYGTSIGHGFLGDTKSRA